MQDYMICEAHRAHCQSPLRLYSMDHFYYFCVWQYLQFL